ncbi:hypothetical protein Bca101_068572 [Brassica carinata]
MGEMAMVEMTGRLVFSELLYCLSLSYLSLSLHSLTVSLLGGTRDLRKVYGGGLGVNNGGLGANNGGLDVVNCGLVRWRKLNNLYGGVLGWWSEVDGKKFRNRGFRVSNKRAVVRAFKTEVFAASRRVELSPRAIRQGSIQAAFDIMVPSGTSPGQTVSRVLKIV